MNKVTHAVVGLVLAVGLALGLAGCTTGASLSAESGPALAPPSRGPTGSTSSALGTIAWPEDCDDLVGAGLAAELGARGLVEGPTDDTIQGRFTGIGNGERWSESISCAYSAVDGREDRFEFGTELLSVDDRAALLDLLRAGPSENTTGLTERRDDDTIFFTQTGAAASGSVPGDWAIAFAVYPDAWTMVWSPAGGSDVLEQHLEWSATLEAQLYPES